MNIQNIQIAQSLFRTAEERPNARKVTISSQQDISLPQVNVPDAKVSGGDALEVVYPPFFPIGNTQDILLIEGVKQLAGEKSHSSAAMEEQKARKQQENSKAASPDLNEVKPKAPQIKNDLNPGVVLDFNV
jgi:hypothetical protein